MITVSIDLDDEEIARLNEIRMQWCEEDGCVCSNEHWYDHRGEKCLTIEYVVEQLATFKRAVYTTKVVPELN